ncbi:hypothetical protein ACXYMP_12635 [Aliiroseovarius sp. CAU 1755]
MLDIEYRLGLNSEEALLRAYEDVAYLDASVLLGGTAFTAGAAKLGINLTRLRPTAALNALRAGRTRLDDMINARRREVDALNASRFAELEAQGHGPQRHEGAVTRQMLEDRVLRGFDPMTGSRSDGVHVGQEHRPPVTASRITSEADYVAADATIQRRADFTDALNAAPARPVKPVRRFRVEVPIEDTLEPDFARRVEGVERIGEFGDSGARPVDVKFEGGTIIAVYTLRPDGSVELYTLYPNKR